MNGCRDGDCTASLARGEATDIHDHRIYYREEVAPDVEGKKGSEAIYFLLSVPHVISQSLQCS